MADIAQPVTVVKSAPRSVGQPTSTSIAQPVRPLRVVPIGYAWKNPA